MNNALQTRQGSSVRRERRGGGAAAITRQTLALEAIALAGRWRRASSGHLILGAGCACSFGPSIALRDLDEFILDYLLHKFAASAQVVACIQAHGAATVAGGLPGLLRAIASGRDGLAVADAALLLRAAGDSIASVEEQHV